MLLTHVVPKNITISGTPIKTFPADVQTTLARAGIREWEYAYEQKAPGSGSRKFMVVLKSGFVPEEQQWNILTHPQNGNFAKNLYKTARYPGSLILEGFSKTQTGPTRVTPGATMGVTPGIVKEARIAPPRAPRPIVITPYDAIVGKAVNELRPLLKEVDVIKLESTCTGDRAGWVSNEDLIKGTPGKQRVIHLCLTKIKDHFKKHFGQPFSLTDISQQQKMKEIIKEYIKIVLEHETEHVQQVIDYGGEFGPGAEQKAEKAEDWKKLEELGIMKKEAMFDVIARLDKLAGDLQSANLIKEATELDVISNTLETKLAFDFMGLISKIPGIPKIRDKNQAMQIIMDFVKKIGMDKVLGILDGVSKQVGRMSMDKQAQIDLQTLFRQFGYPILVAAFLFIAWVGGAGALEDAKKNIMLSQQKQQTEYNQILEQGHVDSRS